MKKKLLSLFLALSMLLTSVLCLLPVAAEGTEDPRDTAAREAGNVCRVGEASEGKYYNNVNTAVSEALKSNNKTVTVTLIDNTTLESNIVVTNGNTFVLDGNNKTLTTSAAFRLEKGALTVKNTIIVTKDSSTSEIGCIVSSGGTLTFGNCTFNITRGYNRNSDGLFVSNTGANIAFELIGCKFSIDKNSKFATQTTETTDADGNKTTVKKVGSVFAKYGNGNATWKLNNTTIDISEIAKLKLGNTEKATLEIKNGTKIKTTQSITNITVTIADSNVEATADANLFDYTNNKDAINITVVKSTLTAKKQVFAVPKTFSTVNISLEGSTVKSTGNGGDNNALYIYQNKNAVTVNVVNTTLESKGHAVQFKETMADVLLSLDGTSKVNGEHRAIQISGIQSSVVVTAAGQTEIQTTDADWTCAIFISGHGNANSFNLTLQDNAKLVSNKSAIKFRNTDSYKMTKATIQVLDNATIKAVQELEWADNLALSEGKVTYIVSGNVTRTVEKEFATFGDVTYIEAVAPTTNKGAAVRIVGDQNGIMFGSTLQELAANANGLVTFVKCGTLIVKAEDIEKAGAFTLEALTKAKEEGKLKFANIEATEEGWTIADGKRTFNASIIGLPDDQITTNFAARSYVVYTINGEEHIVYSAFDSTGNCRSLAGIAQAALDDINETQTGDYQNATVVDGKTVYSPYTASQRVLLEEYAKKKES